MKKVKTLRQDTILTRIRKNCIRNMISPACMVILSLVLLYTIDFNSIFDPIIYTNSFDAYSAYVNGTDNMTLHLSSLKYTGYNIMKNDKVTSVYYYDLYSEKCMFYRLDMQYDSVEEIPPVLENVDISVKLMEPDGLSLSMMETFAQTINWNYTGLSSITFPVIADEHRFNPNFFHAVYILIVILLFYSLLHVAYHIFLLIAPYLHPCYRKLKPYFPNLSYFDMVDRINANFAKKVKVRAGDMFLTDALFVNLGKHEVSIMPLKRLILVYEYGRLFTLFGAHVRISHTIHLCGHKNIKIQASHKKSTDMVLITNYLKEHYPDILWGHTKNTVNAYKQILATQKANQKNKQS